MSTFEEFLDRLHRTHGQTQDYDTALRLAKAGDVDGGMAVLDAIELELHPALAGGGGGGGGDGGAFVGALVGYTGDPSIFVTSHVAFANWTWDTTFLDTDGFLAEDGFNVPAGKGGVYVAYATVSLWGRNDGGATFLDDGYTVGHFDVNGDDWSSAQFARTAGSLSLTADNPFYQTTSWVSPPFPGAEGTHITPHFYAELTDTPSTGNIQLHGDQDGTMFGIVRVGT